MRSPTSLLSVLGLLAAVACGDETPDPAANSTSGAASATTTDSTSGSGGSTAGSTPTTGGDEPTGGSTGATTAATTAEDVGGSSSTTAGAETTGGMTNDSGQSSGGGTDVTGETSGGAGESDGGATGDARDTTTGDAGVVEVDVDAGDDTVRTDSKLCSETHPEGGCDTGMIAACVCEGPSAGVEGEPSCCEAAVSGDDAKNGWDEVCQIIAYSEGCAGNCCEVHPEGSCELPSVEKCVCDALPECCMPADDSEVTQNGWDGLCLAAAAACGAPCI